MSTQQISVTRSPRKDALYHMISLPPYTLTIAARKEDLDSDDEDLVDPYLFDPSYTLAAATGFSIWEGAIALLSFLHSPSEENAELRQRLFTDRQLAVELGSGTGVAGLGVAMMGAHVLGTDVESVVTGSLKANVALNCKSDDGSAEALGWNQAVTIGSGTVAAQPLDWSLPLSKQRTPNDPFRATTLLATETAWLADLAPLFVDVASELLSTPAPDSTVHKVMYWAYKERGTSESKIFTTMPYVETLFVEKGCVVERIWRQESKEDEGKGVVVNRVWWHGDSTR
ncbi:hypothetical protein BC832DRAFT_558901 [Gaertneriomyces semiglobifer]|nr:hypothetical protein BC832DRAFT_558901 [Gaertneriomyces semiglobifer]